MFIKSNSGEIFHILKCESSGCWVISFDGGKEPAFFSEEEIDNCERIPSPKEYVDNMKRKRSEAEQKKLDAIKMLTLNQDCVSNPELRTEVIKAIAKEHDIGEKTVRRVYYDYLSRGEVIKRKPRDMVRRKDFEDAIKKYYYSSKHYSLKTTYELFILENYSDNGKLLEDHPTYNSFRAYYYRYIKDLKQKSISRDGLTHYKRNVRPIYGSAMAYRDKIGSYQIDATQADIYLVSSIDRTKVIGRPNLYLAVDVATQLITGFYAGFEADETALMSCIYNAASNKVEYCKRIGIEIIEKDWPSSGLMSEIITDKGSEMQGGRVSELCIRYGITIQNIGPFRPEQKPLVERAMEHVQNAYRSTLTGKGVVQKDSVERWAKDYREEAVLTLDEYRKIIAITVITLNKGRVLENIGHLSVDAPRTPSTLWQWFKDNGKSSILDVDEKEIYVLSLPRKEIKVSRKGLVINGIRYLTDENNALEIGKKVEVAYDINDTSRVFALLPDGTIISCYLARSESELQEYSYKEAAEMKELIRKKLKEARENELSCNVELHSSLNEIIKNADKECGHI